MVKRNGSRGQEVQGQGAISGNILFLSFSKTGGQKAEEEQEREGEGKGKRRQGEPNLPFYACSRLMRAHAVLQLILEGNTRDSISSYEPHPSIL